MSTAEAKPEPAKSRSFDLRLVLAVWLSLLVYGVLAAPTPAVNEPHYLCKARHFWQSDWCAKDFFLASPNAHTVFYVSIGWLTRWLSFEQTAWVGRAIATLVLALGWTSLTTRLLGVSSLMGDPIPVPSPPSSGERARVRGPNGRETLEAGVTDRSQPRAADIPASSGLKQSPPHPNPLPPKSGGRGDKNSRPPIHDCTRLLAQRWSPLAACWLFLAFASCGSLSGEWLVGGVEGKVFSYGFLFASLGQMLRERIVLASALAGLAVAFHPVVGAWGVLAFAGASVGDVRFWISDFGLKERPDLGLQSKIQNPKSKIASLLLLILLALPGLIPVVQLLLEPAPAATKYAATYIQVYYRLAHHLDPMLFPLRAYAGYVVLLGLWLIGRRGEASSDAKRQFDRIVGWSILFAAAGWFIGWGARPAKLMPYFGERMHLLKFYPFRLADVLLPVAVSVTVVRWWEQSTRGSSERDRGLQTDAEPGRSRPSLGKQMAGLTPKTAMFGALLLFVFALWRAHSVVEVNRYSGELRADWIDACRWIDRHLPAEALVQAPHNGWAFKWFAGRAEYVAFKDCPQDAVGIVEWNRRLLFLKKWYEDQYVDQFYSADELRDLRRQTGITHLLTDRLGPLELEPLYRNATFQVYDLSSLD